MQDKIIGPLTMVQFVYAVIGFGFCYLIFMSMPAPLSYVLALPIAIFVICLDFVKVNERPFLDFFLSMLAFLGAPKKRVWHQGDDSDMSIEIYHVKKSNEPTIQHKTISREEIERVAKRTDTGASLIRE